MAAVARSHGAQHRRPPRGSDEERRRWPSAAPAVTDAPQLLTPAQASEAAALASGEVNLIPVIVVDGEIRSPIGTWKATERLPDGPAVAIARPTAFRQVAPGEESDLILGIEEAGFYEGAWHIRGFISGAQLLRVTLSADQPLHKGRLIALSYDPARFRIVTTGGA